MLKLQDANSRTEKGYERLTARLGTRTGLFLIALGCGDSLEVIGIVKES